MTQAATPTTLGQLNPDGDCHDWCEGHGDEDTCVTEWSGVSRYDDDGAHALVRLTSDDGEQIALAVLDPTDDTEAEISLCLVEARELRDQLTALLALAGAS